MIWGPIIAAGASGLGSALGNMFGDEGPGTTEQLNAAGRMAARTASGNILGIMDAATKTGLHPLAALGIGGGGGGGSVSFDGGTDFSSVGESMGQNLGRAAEAYMGKEQRVFDRKFRETQLEGEQLQNDLLRSEIALKRTAATKAISTSSVIPGQSAGSPFNLDPGVKVIPKEVTANIGSHEKGIEAGTKLVDYGLPGKPFVVPVYAGQDDNEVLMSLHAAGISLPSMIHEWMRKNVKPSIKSGLKSAKSWFNYKSDD